MNKFAYTNGTIGLDPKRTSRRYRAHQIGAAVLGVLIIALFFFALASIGGCSQVQARASTAVLIDTQAVCSQAIIEQIASGQLATTQASDQVSANAAHAQAIFQKTTVNPFAYLFGPKELLASPGWYENIRMIQVVCVIDARRAETQPALAPQYAGQEARLFLTLKAVKDAAPAPPQATTQPAKR